MNDVKLSGNLVADPDVKTVTFGGKSSVVASFRLANNRFYRQSNGDKGEATIYIDCEAWDSGAETIGKLLAKGDGVVVSGYLKMDNWEKDGQKFSKLKLRVDEFIKVRRPSAEPTQAPVDTQAEEPVAAGTNIPF